MKNKLSKKDNSYKEIFTRDANQTLHDEIGDAYLWVYADGEAAIQLKCQKFGDAK